MGIPLTFKVGVDLRGLQPEMLPVMIAACARFEEVGAPYVMITSGLDGKHSAKSLHYSGRALDFRTRHISEASISILANLLRQDLGGQYDVVLEPTHLHIEFDPK